MFHIKTGLVVTLLTTSAFITPLNLASAADFTLTGNSTWDSAAGTDDLSGVVDDDNVDIGSHDFTIEHVPFASSKDIGSIVGTTGNVLVDGNHIPGSSNTSQYIDSVNLSSGNFTVEQQIGAASARTYIRNGFTLGGNLTVTHLDTNTATTPLRQMTFQTNGDLNVTGTTVIDNSLSQAANAVETYMTLAGNNNTFNGQVTVIGGQVTNANASISLNGSSVDFLGGLVLRSDNSGEAVFNLSGSAGVTQTINGTIDGFAQGDGEIRLYQHGTKTFTGVIGGTNAINSIAFYAPAGGDARLVFQENVNVYHESGLGAIRVRASADSNSVIEFEKNLTVSGSAGTIAGNRDVVSLDDNGINKAIAYFNGSSTQSVQANFNAASTGEGLILINNDVNLTGQIGTSNAIGEMSITDGNTLAFTMKDGDNRINTITLDGTAKLVLLNSGGTGLSGNVEASNNGDGVLEFGGSSNVLMYNGVGTSSNSIGSINVNGLANSRGVTISGDVYTQGIHFDAPNLTDENFMTLQGDTTVTGNVTTAENDEHTITFAGSSKSVSGNIGASAALFKQVYVTNGNLTLGGDLYTSRLALAGGRTLLLNGSVDQSMGITNLDGGGDIHVNNSGGAKAIFENALTNIGQLRLFNGSNSSYAGSMGLSTLDLEGGSTVTLAGTHWDNGTTLFTVPGAVTVTGTGGVSFVVDASALNLAETDTVTLIDGSTTALDLNDYNSLYGTFSLADSDMDLVFNYTGLNTIPDPDANPELAPQADAIGGAKVAAMGISDNITQTITGRLTGFSGGTSGAGVKYSLNTGHRSGVSAGEGVSTGDQGYWLRPVAGRINQERKDGVDGFNASILGMVMGYDKDISNDMTLGLAAAYSYANVDGDGVGNGQTDVDSYMAAVYGDYTTDKNYLQGIFSFGWNQQDSSRSAGGNTATANYDSYMVSFSAESGWPMELENETTVTPFTTVKGSWIKTEGYQESGAGLMNAEVDENTDHSVDGILGVKIDKDYLWKDGVLTPLASISGGYNLIQAENVATSRYVAGGSSFEIEGAKADRYFTQVQLGLGYDREDQALGLRYDGTYSASTNAHSLVAEYRWKF